MKSHTHSYTCPSGYVTSCGSLRSTETTSKKCSCGATSGTCYKCKTQCSDGGYWNEWLCSDFSGYEQQDCTTAQGNKATECRNRGIEPGTGKGECDVDSLRRCCSDCIGLGAI